MCGRTRVAPLIPSNAATRTTGPVFPSPDGDFATHLGASRFRQDLGVTALSPTYEGHNVTFHAARRTLLTLLSISGVDDATIGRITGHAKKTVTRKHYVAELADLYTAALKLPFPHSVQRAVPA
jgi:integrase